MESKLGKTWARFIGHHTRKTQTELEDVKLYARERLIDFREVKKVYEKAGCKEGEKIAQASQDAYQDIIDKIEE